MGYLRKVIFTGLAMLSLLLPAHSFSASAATLSDLAAYQGADREQRLIAGAKKEGGLSFYTSMAAKDIKAVTTGFEKKYGIKATVWRASANDVLQRALTEASANRHEFDVITMTTPEMEAVYREKLLQEVLSPHYGDLLPATVPAHKSWAGIYINVFVQAYNTNKVKKEELPKTYFDLLDPRWKGRLGMEVKSQEWFYGVVKDMGEEKGLKFFRDLVAINKPSLRSGNTVIKNLVVAGEIPFALSVYHYLAEQDKRGGAPIDWLTLDPVLASFNGVGVSRQARHPYAALLFYDYLMTDAQQMFVDVYRVPTNKKFDSPFKKIKVKLLDPAAGLDEYDKATKLYENVLQGK